jgi:hypothetical protein
MTQLEDNFRPDEIFEDSRIKGDVLEAIGSLIADDNSAESFATISAVRVRKGEEYHYALNTNMNRHNTYDEGLLLTITVQVPSWGVTDAVKSVVSFAKDELVAREERRLQEAIDEQNRLLASKQSDIEAIQAKIAELKSGK